MRQLPFAVMSQFFLTGHSPFCSILTTWPEQTVALQLSLNIDGHFMIKAFLFTSPAQKQAL